MNKTFRSFLLLLSSSFLLSSCGDGNSSSSSVSQASLTISQASLSLEAYEKATLTYTLTGVEGTPTWSSSDETVATVSSSGEVNAIKAGTCQISVALGELKSTCSLTVAPLSQAPRIVLSESRISLDKGSSYVIDAYVLYKNEARTDALEITKKDSSSDVNAANVSYENKKLTITGLDYGSEDFIVHVKSLGVLLTANLHVDVVNADIALSLTNLTPVDGEYSLDLGLYQVDEDGLPNSFAPEISFTDKGEPAEYELTYTTQDDSIVAWDKNHSLIAKGVGETTAKITCEKFRLSLEISISVVKGAYDVKLLNLDEGGATSQEKVGNGKLPKTVPSIDGKSFQGWYDEEGNQVTSVTDDITLIAKWGVLTYTERNQKLLSLTNNASDYSTPSGVDGTFATRSDNDIKTDINQWHIYPGTPEGSQGFYPGEDAEKSLGLGLPAFDFASAGPVHFTFGFAKGGVWADETHKGVFFNGTSVGIDQYKHPSANFDVGIVSGVAKITNNDAEQTYSIPLSEEVNTGKKGLEITVDKNWGSWLFVTSFSSLNCDYFAFAKQIEESLPEVFEGGYEDEVEEYQKYRTYFTSYEQSAYPISSKMAYWIKAITPTKVYEFTDNGASVISSVTGNGADQVVCGDAPTPYEGEENSLKMYMQGLDRKYVTLALPAFDYSAYGSVSFTMGVGGGPGGENPFYFYGGITEPDGGYDTSTWDGRILTLNKSVGRATSDSARNDWNNEFTKVTISKGVIHFNSSIISDVTRTLDEEVNNGTKGLTLSLGICSWNGFVITPFYATGVVND